MWKIMVIMIMSDTLSGMVYMLAFVCIIRSFAGTYKQTAFICKETNSIKFIWLMLDLPKSDKLVHL